MKCILTGLLCSAAITIFAQEPAWQGKFEQLDNLLPTPNEYRNGAGSPGPAYWQQTADHIINVELDDNNQRISGSETITYHNNSPDALNFLWLQVDQNILAKNNAKDATTIGVMEDSLPANSYALPLSDFDGGYNITSVTDENGKKLFYVINQTMMRVDLPQALKHGENFSFNITWNYNINDRQVLDERSGYEFFPEDENYLYTIAQFFPRMCVYDDYEGWQNKQFLDQGEFTTVFGNFKVRITVPSDHVVASTGILMNAKEVLSKVELERYERSKKTFDKPVLIVTQAEALQREKTKSTSKKTWEYHADNVRDFAFASSRKFIWEAQAVKIGNKTPLAMAYYSKEGNPLWEREATRAIKNTLEVYSRQTIDYPYPVAIAVHTAKIAMEYPMISFDRGRPSKDGKVSAATKQSMVGAIIHEVGHNFFPMIVNSDERQSTWMDEGLNSFLQLMTELERYPESDYNWTRGIPEALVPYMKGDKKSMRPLMVNSEQVIKFGSEQYAKAATGLYILRETIMGRELFDKAFKEYSVRWAFKHPKPADFFRTMEDASAVDLDWFWRGWFYTTDQCDISVERVKWFRLRKNDAENLKIAPRKSQEGERYQNFKNGPEYFSLRNSGTELDGEFLSSINELSIIQKLENKNIYEVTLINKGGLVMSVIIEWTFKDGTKQTDRIPAEIWRVNESKVNKVFVKEKEVISMVVDPKKETTDVNQANNVFPKVEDQGSSFEQFKKKSN